MFRELSLPFSLRRPRENPAAPQSYAGRDDIRRISGRLPQVSSGSKRRGLMKEKQLFAGRAVRPLALLIAAGVAVSSAGAAADVSVRTIALTGGAAGEGLVFQRFDSLTINDSGRVLFGATVGTSSAANDNCTGAIEVFAGATLVRTHGTTPSVGGCVPGNDAWFAYTAPAAGPVWIGISGMDFAARISVHRGACAPLPAAVRCDNGAVTFAAGETVHIRISGISSGTHI